MPKRYDISESALREMYVDKGMKMEDIAAYYECSPWVIRDRLNAYHIPIRAAGDYVRIDISRDELYERYVERGMTQAKIAEEFQCSPATIIKLMKQYGIEARVQSGGRVDPVLERAALARQCAWHHCHNALTERQRYFCSRACGYKYRSARQHTEMKQQSVDYKGGKCSLCGYERCIDALTFHHVTGQKEFGIAAHIHSQTWTVIQAELDKCILVCANCHSEIHAGLHAAIAQVSKASKHSNTERRRNAKQQAVAYKGGRCVVCGYDRCADALAFHHVEGQKEFGIAFQGRIRSWPVIQAELDRCIMVCANCHAEIHAGLHDVTGLMGRD